MKISSEETVNESSSNLEANKKESGDKEEGEEGEETGEIEQTESKMDVDL
jgi:hypothetical protein